MVLIVGVATHKATANTNNAQALYLVGVLHQRVGAST